MTDRRARTVSPGCEPFWARCLLPWSALRAQRTCRAFSSVAIPLFVILGASQVGAEMDKPLISLLDDVSEDRFNDAEKRLEKGQHAEGIRLLQLLLEDISGRSLLLPSEQKGPAYRVSVNAAQRIRELMRRYAATASAAYRREFDPAAEALYERALALNDAAGLARCHSLYPLASIADLAAVAASELFLEAGDTACAALLLGDLPMEDTREGLRSRLALLWMSIAIDRGDGAMYEEWSRRHAAIPGAPPSSLLPQPPVAWGGALSLPELPFSAGRLAWSSPRMRTSQIGESSRFAPELLVHGDWVAMPIRSSDWEQSVRRLSLPNGRILQEETLSRGLSADDGGELQYDASGASAKLERLYAASNGSVLVTSYISWVSERDDYWVYKIKSAIPRRSLKGMRVRDAAEAQSLWDTATSQDSRLRDFSFNSRPVIAGNRVYALAWQKSGYVDAYLVALELETGEMAWQRHLVANQIELTMFGEIQREPLLGDLLYEHGLLYASTNLGVIACATAQEGEVLWLTEYDTRRIPYNSFREVREMREPPWDRNPMLLGGDRIVATPLDSEVLLNIEKASGKVVQSVSCGEFKILVGIHESEIVLCKKDACRLVPMMEGDKRTRTLPFGRDSEKMSARPALVRGGLLYPTPRGVYFRSFGDEGPDRTIFLHETPRGSVAAKNKQPARDSEGVVYIASSGGRSFILVLSTTQIACYEEKPPEPPAPAERRPR